MHVGRAQGGSTDVRTRRGWLWSGEVCADILARRSPEGRPVAERLHRDEEAATAVRQRLVVAIAEKRDFADDFAAFEQALAKGDRLRSEAYRMAIH